MAAGGACPWRMCLPPVRLLSVFAGQQALACVFPFSLMATLAATQVCRVPVLPRYDLVLLACLLLQFAMYRAGWETRDEVKVIAVFHAIGLGLELFKTHMGSWAYPEPAWTKVAGVPLYSGFMYASVASYLCQAWRRLDVRLTGWPPGGRTLPLAVALYANFFTEHVLPDARWPLLLVLLLVFRRTVAGYTVAGERFRMPMPLAFALVGLFVWVAENVATFLGAWQYPDQRHGWHAVHWGKITSWSVLVMISFILVAQLKHYKEGTARVEEAEGACGKIVQPAPTVD